MIEECAKGNPFTIWVKPETRVALAYFKESARALVELGKAPVEDIKTTNYVLAGITPTPSAGELADVVRAKIPGAQIEFKPDLELEHVLDQLCRPIDESNAQREWGWQSVYDLDRIVDDFLRELKLNPQQS